jgi:hypothetical protein
MYLLVMVNFLLIKITIGMPYLLLHDINNILYLNGEIYLLYYANEHHKHDLQNH